MSALVLSAKAFKVLQAVEFGLLTFGQAWAMIRNAKEEQRDLTDAEMDSIGIRTDATHADFLDAVRRQKERERNGN